jgi:guanosine-3',5'-bis(diphosphate) 3'-pyrophosphohydrolase
MPSEPIIGAPMLQLQCWAAWAALASISPLMRQDAIMDTSAPLLTALEFAAHKHRHQRRKGANASPYINHPIAMARLLSVEGGVTDVKTLMAAVLHDTIEDSETSYDERRDHFGRKVDDVAAAVTDVMSLPTARRKALQIEHAPHASKRAAPLKLADKTCNLRDMAHHPPAGWPLARRRQYFDWARAVVDALPRARRGACAAAVSVTS